MSKQTLENHFISQQEQHSGLSATLCSVIQVIADIDAPEPAEEKINAFLAAQADKVDGIVTTAWVPAVVAANSLRKIGDKRIKMVGIDHD